jgi:hypothetical protein
MRVVADHLVDAMGDGTPLFGRKRAFRPAEVEAHAVDSDPRTGLIHVVAKHVFERALQKVRGGVVPPNLTPPRFMNAGTDPIAARELTLDDDAVVRDRFAHVLRIAHLEESLC